MHVDDGRFETDSSSPSALRSNPNDSIFVGYMVGPDYGDCYFDMLVGAKHQYSVVRLG